MQSRAPRRVHPLRGVREARRHAARNRIRRAETLEMHATLVDVPAGADLLEALMSAGVETGYLPLVILSGHGILSRATLRVPNDDALSDIFDSDTPFGVDLDLTGEHWPEGLMQSLTVPEGETVIDPPWEGLGINPRPHWSSVQTFLHPLRILAARGGRMHDTSEHNFHLIVSGSPTRPSGPSETFLAQLLPGCITAHPMQFVLGIATSFSRGSTVQAWSISIYPGEEVLAKLKTFLSARQNLRPSFLLSATGTLSSATFTNLNADETSSSTTLEETDTPYPIESLTALITPQEAPQLHIAVIDPATTRPHDSYGGLLTNAILSDEGNFDLYLAEMTASVPRSY